MRRFWLPPRFFSLFLLLGLCGGQARAVSPAAYAQALAQVQGAVVRQAQANRAEQIPTGEAPSLVAQRVLAPIHSIDAGDAPQTVDTAPLIAEVKAAEAVHGTAARAEALETLSRRITVLRRALPGSGNPPRVPDPVKTVQSARSVLAGDEFAADPPPPPSAAERFGAWLDRWLAKLFHRPAPSPNLAPLPTIDPRILQGIFVIIALAAFGILVYLLVQALGRREARSKPLELGAEEAALVEARDNDTLLALAEQQAQAGDYRRAFRLVYLAALVALDTGGVLRFDRSKTNWEYLRALRAAGRGDIYQALTPLTREFDQVWYGFSRPDAAQYAHAVAQYRALLATSPAETQKAVSV